MLPKDGVWPKVVSKKGEFNSKRRTQRRFFWVQDPENETIPERREIHSFSRVGFHPSDTTTLRGTRTFLLPS